MRVLQVAPSLNRIYGGPVYSLVAFARTAQSVGIEATIAGPNSPRTELEWIHSELPGVKVHSFPTAGKDAFIFSPAMLAWLQKNGHRFDVIHVHGLLNPVSSFAARTAMLLGVPYVVHPFGTLSKYTFTHRRSLLKRAYFNLIDEQNIRNAGAVHFTTVTERDEAGWHSLDWGDRAHVVPPPWIGDIEIQSSYRPMKMHGTNVLLMARLHPVKNVEDLLDAWPEVLRQIPSATLTIAGDGKADYVRKLRAFAASLGPESRIRFLGFAREEAKKKLLASADVFVLPSYHENFGVVVLEALAAGIPVVITPEVQLSSFVTDHKLGILVARSPWAIATGIVQILNDIETRRRCRADAPGLVVENFAPGKLGERLKKMYNSAITETRRRASQI